MRIIESAGFYYPDSSGGTEVYVSFLAKGLQAQGVECTIAAPSPSEEASQYVHQGTEVFRYPVPERFLQSEIQGRAPPRQFGVFVEWLREHGADVYHQHSWTSGCGLWHLKAAKRLGLKTVVTVHVPGNICMRGTMLHEGRAPCDGKILPERCGSCWLQSKGVPAGAARILAKLPQRLGPLMRVRRVGPALVAQALAADRKKQLHDMAATADRIVAPCGWLYDALIANDIPIEKLVLNRQGVGHWAQVSPLQRANKASDVFRFGFLGRWDPVKGLHILVEAFKRLPSNLAVELNIWAVGETGVARKYRENVRLSAAGDRRIRFLPSVPHNDVACLLAGIDALAVPSQCLETGPIVVLEAFAAGTPVIGSDLGGIRELVSHGRDGFLVPHTDVSAWTTILVRMATDRALLDRLRKGIGPVRNMSDVARDMATLYRELCAIGCYAA